MLYTLNIIVISFKMAGIYDIQNCCTASYSDRAEDLINEEDLFTCSFDSFSIPLKQAIKVYMTLQAKDYRINYLERQLKSKPAVLDSKCEQDIQREKQKYQAFEQQM